ncbi:MAG: N-acetyltransferase [Candidatus Acidiferrales bacterium]
MISIRSAEPRDHHAIWTVLEPTIRAGETYTLPRHLSREDALAYWFAPEHEVFVAEDGAAAINTLAGTYFLQANQRGGGAHVANCGYVTAPGATGRGVAGAMCEHSLVRARERGFRALQFNFVVASNTRAVRLWLKHGFSIVGTLPAAFAHPQLGLTDAYVMFREL